MSHLASDVTEPPRSKLRGAPCEPSASGHIWFFSARALVLDTALTSSHAMHTTWPRLWSAWFRPQPDPSGRHHASSSTVCPKLPLPVIVSLPLPSLDTFGSEISSFCGPPKMKICNVQYLQNQNTTLFFLCVSLCKFITLASWKES